MISVIITTYGEIGTIKKAIDVILPQLTTKDEVLIVSPDRLMGAVVEDCRKKYKNIYLFYDKGVGKPSALNLVLQKARGDILVLTDGDVYMSNQAIYFLKKSFTDNNVGAVSGHPVSVEDQTKMFGYWSYLLANEAHQIRLKKDNFASFLECSGYLYAIRQGLITKVPEDALAEDAVISHVIANAGFKIKYAPKAYVSVKYPKNYKDWLRQKIRSAGGYTQTYVLKSKYKMRTFWGEFFTGPKIFFQYPKNIKQIFWIIILLMARLHLWALIVFKVRLQKQSLLKLWKRVESTK